MSLPVVKLLTLALRTLSKPVAISLKQHAAIHPWFRHFIIHIAQSNHRITTKLQRRVHSYAMDAEIRPLNEERAVQVAADLIGELFVFSVGGVLLIFEVQRNAKSEARKEEQRKQEQGAVKQRQEDLTREMELLKQRLEEVEKLARGRGLSGVMKFKQGNTENGKTGKAVIPDEQHILSN